MRKLNVEIIGVSEMRWPVSGYCDTEDYRVYYFGITIGTYENGVGLIIKKDEAGHITNFVPMSERVMLLQLNTSPVNTNIIQICACNPDHSERR